jgi:hypothetical protein
VRGEEIGWSAAAIWKVLTKNKKITCRYDIDLEAAIDFVEAIGQSVRSCAVLIAVVASVGLTAIRSPILPGLRYSL